MKGRESLFGLMLSKFRYSIFHPQWHANTEHRSSKNFIQWQNHSVVLDVGSGDGVYHHQLPSSCSVIRLDYPATNAKYLTAPDVFGDARFLPIRSASVDAVLFFEVMEHIPPNNRLLAEFRRVLRSGGTLYISMPFLYPEHDSPNDYCRYTATELTRALAGHGFEVTRLRQHGNSLSTALQLFSLAILDCMRSLKKRVPILFWLIVPIGYLATLVANLGILIVRNLPLPIALNLGTFVTAKPFEQQGP
jgi:SAM-dependent methyltransferase